MLEELRNIQGQLNKLKAALPKPLTKQVQSKSVKDGMKGSVDYFFRIVRPSLINSRVTEAELASIDMIMQQLLEFTHKNMTGVKYSRALKEAITSTVTLEGICLARGTTVQRKALSTSDERIIQTLNAFLPSAANSYEQAIMDLQGPNRLSWRGPATDLREALRETLDHLAPDKEIEAQPGFKLEKDTKGPTMKQKVRFVLSKRGLSAVVAATTENAATTVEELLGAFVRSIYTRSNISTHTSTNKDEVLRVRDLVRLALCELLAIPT